MKPALAAIVAWMLSVEASYLAGQSYSATNLWKAPGMWGTRSSPALGTDGTIYIGTWSGRLLALNPDGSKRWAFRTGLEMASSPAVGTDETVYIGCRDRRFYAVDRRGKLKWFFPTGGWVDASAALATDGTIYFGSWDKQFYALNPDGSKRWVFSTGGPIVSSAAIGADGTIYFGSHDRNFYALNPDGSLRWRFATGGAILSSPAIGADGAIYFSSVDGKLHALNPDGSARWHLHTGGVTGSSPVLGADGTIFISVNTNHCAVNADGTFKWVRRFWHPGPGAYGDTAAAVLANGHVIFTGGDGYVMTVLHGTGDRDWVWNFWLYAPSHSSVVVSPEGTVYAACTGAYLYALQNNVPLANTPWPMFRADPQHTGRVRIGAR
ncbi:MAG: PQQ-binding-like beta-propeller repeat protein [Verrucomicrobiae bacterium]|nr:PQQ-binding-like beta-propeller repeat protein [Verrucomicrobiae bacterium]